MTTHRALTALFSSFVVTTLIGCGSDVTAGGSGEGPAPAIPAGKGTPRPTTPPASSGLAYPGHGFIVHEWGTNTIVVGSDGSLQRGLHHEEEDLPAFVYDRMKAGAVLGSPVVVVSKMETPVTYFYSDTPRTVDVAVDFPRGVLTQWYPAVRSFSPPLLQHWQGPNGAQVVDPVLDPTVEFGSDNCKEQYSHPALGRLDWGRSRCCRAARRPSSSRRLSTSPRGPSRVTSTPIRCASGPRSRRRTWLRRSGFSSIVASATSSSLSRSARCRVARSPSPTRARRPWGASS